MEESIETRIARSHQRGEKGTREERGSLAHKLEKIAKRWHDDYENQETEVVDTPAGRFKISKGRGKQPYATTRLEDFGNVRMTTDYSSVASTLNTDGVAIAKLTLRMLEAESEMEKNAAKRQIQAQNWKVRRAITFIVSITHICEEARYFACGKVSRGELRSIVAGAATFNSVFAGPKPRFPQVATAQGTRLLVEENSGYFNYLKGHLSDSSDDESKATPSPLPSVRRSTRRAKPTDRFHPYT
jgi:hypothetical protein